MGYDQLLIVQLRYVAIESKLLLGSLYCRCFAIDVCSVHILP